MALIVRCASCNQELRFKEEHAGMRGRCSKCGQAVVIPKNGPPATPLVPPPQPVPEKTPSISRPVLLVRTRTATVPVKFHLTGWTAPDGGLPFGWLRRLFYESGAFGVWLGRGLDESLDTLTRETESADPGPTTDSSGVAEAISVASIAGVAGDSVQERLELNRLQIDCRTFGRARSIVAMVRRSVRALAIGLIVLLPTMFVALSIWGLAAARRLRQRRRDSPYRWLFPGWGPIVFVDSGIRRFRRASGPGRLILGLMLASLGFGIGMFALVFFAFTIFWPPAFIRRLSRTGDAVLVTPTALVFHSAFLRATAIVPRDWPMVEWRLKRYVMILGHEESSEAQFCPVWIIRLPAEWVQKQGLKTVPRENVRQLLTRAKQLLAQK